jgi:hypothetical protein
MSIDTTLTAAELQRRHDRRDEFAAEWASAIAKLGRHFATPVGALPPETRDRIRALEENARQPTSFVCGVITVGELRAKIALWADALREASTEAYRAIAPRVLQ